VRCRAHGRVVHTEIAADRAHHHFTRIQAHADLRQQTLAAAHVLRVPLYRLLHAQGRVTRPDGVIFVGERRPEERHDAVAHHLVDGPLVAVDGLHHVLEDWIKELSRLLGVPVGGQLHRAFHVGEEHRHLFPFSLQRVFGGQDLLGNVPRRVGGWRGRA
jgi:hypothetical protein